jgi:predicted MPP superfamily phosphohydrolase
MKLRVRKEVISLPNLPSDLDGYVIMHISDLHFKDYMNKDEALNSVISSQRADLVLITGDFITSDDDIDPVIDFLKKIKSKDGIFATLGNHDYVYSTILEAYLFSKIRGDKKNNVARLIELLKRIGVRLLINEYVLIKARTSRIFVEGTDDPHLGYPLISDMDENYKKSDLKILLSHSPDMLYSQELKKKSFDLMLSGHTHGGQIRIPIVGPLATSTRFAQRNETLGLFKRDTMYVNVSSGVGHSALPIRINCPAEIVLITLKKS